MFSLFFESLPLVLSRTFFPWDERISLWVNPVFPRKFYFRFAVLYMAKRRRPDQLCPRTEVSKHWPDENLMKLAWWFWFNWMTMHLKWAECIEWRFVAYRDNVRI